MASRRTRPADEHGHPVNIIMIKGRAWNGSLPEAPISDADEAQKRDCQYMGGKMD